MNLPQYEIIKLDKGAGHLLLKVSLPADLIFFKGHFPDYPVLPGVAQVFIAERLANRYFSTFGDFTGMKQLKFSRPVTPVAFLFLALELNTEKGTLAFRYFNADEVKSKGLIGYINNS